MAHIGEFEINTNGQYVKLLDFIPNFEMVDGTTYTLQIRGNIITQVAPETPTKGGFIVKDLTPVCYKHKQGNDLYIRTCEEGCIINIAE